MHTQTFILCWMRKKICKNLNQMSVNYHTRKRFEYLFYSNIEPCNYLSNKIFENPIGVIHVWTKT